MESPGEVQIRPLLGPSRASLRLQGTILTYRERYWSGEVSVDIPVELVTFSEGRAFKGARLIAALLSILLLPALGGGLFAAWGLVALPSEAVVVAFVSATIAATLVAFVVLLVRFFRRQPTMSIHVEGIEGAITFWMEADQAEDLRRLRDDVLSRQALVAETIGFPMRDAVGDRLQRPWRRTVVLTFLFLIPALVTEIPWLLVAGLIPLGLHVVGRAREARQPREYRQAIRHALAAEWASALEQVNRLTQRQPGNQQARLFQIELLMRVADFDGAEAALASLQDGLDAETVQAVQRDIILRRRVWERKREDRITPAPQSMTRHVTS